MPLGSAQKQHVAQLSYSALRRLIEQVRGWFDVILIDTGPILGSLEAPVAIMAADAVVLTVASGEQRPLIKRAIDQIAIVGNDKLAGIVLNRASAGDVAASGFSSSSTHRARDSSSQHAQPISVIDHQSLRLGPIGSAVLNVGADSGPSPKSS
jgi:Mrp family chromosome partitioning ATPase